MKQRRGAYNGSSFRGVSAAVFPLGGAISRKNVTRTRAASPRKEKKIILLVSDAMEHLINNHSIEYLDRMIERGWFVEKSRFGAILRQYLTIPTLVTNCSR